MSHGTRLTFQDIRLAAPSGATGGWTTAMCFGSCMGERIGLGVRRMDAACMWAGRAAAEAGVAGVCWAMVANDSRKVFGRAKWRGFSSR